MVERHDPAQAGVRAGRVVGALTAVLAVWSLLRVQDSFYEGTSAMLDLVGLDLGIPVAAIFWTNVAFAAAARYAISYVVGSLIGVVYDWLDAPPAPVLVAGVLVVGAVDGVHTALNAQSLVVGTFAVVAWLCFVPAFYWYHDAEAARAAEADGPGETPDGRTRPRRLGEE